MVHLIIVASHICRCHSTSSFSLIPYLPHHLRFPTRFCHLSYSFQSIYYILQCSHALFNHLTPTLCRCHNFLYPSSQKNTSQAISDLPATNYLIFHPGCHLTYDFTTASTIATAVGHSRLHLCNSLYHSLYVTQFKHLQKIQNALARAVIRTTKHSNITSTLISTPWLMGEQHTIQSHIYYS